MDLLCYWLKIVARIARSLLPDVIALPPSSGRFSAYEKTLDDLEVVARILV